MRPPKRVDVRELGIQDSEGAVDLETVNQLLRQVCVAHFLLVLMVEEGKISGLQQVSRTIQWMEGEALQERRALALRCGNGRGGWRKENGTRIKQMLWKRFSGEKRINKAEMLRAHV